MDHRLSLVGSLYDSNLFWEEKFSYMNVTHDLPGHLTGRKIHPGLFWAARDTSWKAAWKTCKLSK